jgi:hypothetical protein
MNGGHPARIIANIRVESSGICHSVAEAHGGGISDLRFEISDASETEGSLATKRQEAQNGHRIFTEGRMHNLLILPVGICSVVHSFPKMADKELVDSGSRFTKRAGHARTRILLNSPLHFCVLRRMQLDCGGPLYLGPLLEFHDPKSIGGSSLPGGTHCVPANVAAVIRVDWLLDIW